MPQLVRSHDFIPGEIYPEYCGAFVGEQRCGKPRWAHVDVIDQAEDDPDIIDEAYEPTHQDSEGNPAPPGHRETTENEEAKADEKVGKINELIYDHMNEGDIPSAITLSAIEKIIHG